MNIFFKQELERRESICVSIDDMVHRINNSFDNPTTYMHEYLNPVVADNPLAEFRVYFDIDVDLTGTDNFEIEDEAILDLATNVVSNCFGIDKGEITICTSSCNSYYNAKKKQHGFRKSSYHLTLPFKTTIANNKVIAKQLESIVSMVVKRHELGIRLPIFDSLPYHSNGQSWRMVNQFKKGETGSENRRKRLVQGTIESTFLQFIDGLPSIKGLPIESQEELIDWLFPSCLLHENVFVTSFDERGLSWAYQVLLSLANEDASNHDKCRIIDIIRQKSGGVYGNFDGAWVEVIKFVCGEIQGNNNPRWAYTMTYFLVRLSVYSKRDCLFDMLNKVDIYSKKTFKRVDISGWFRNRVIIEDVVADFTMQDFADLCSVHGDFNMDEIFPEYVEPSSSTIASSVIDFSPYSVTQYRIMEYLIRPCFTPVWESRIKCTDDLSIVIQLLHQVPPCELNDYDVHRKDIVANCNFLPYDLVDINAIDAKIVLLAARMYLRDEVVELKDVVKMIEDFLDLINEVEKSTCKQERRKFVPFTSETVRTANMFPNQFVSIERSMFNCHPTSSTDIWVKTGRQGIDPTIRNLPFSNFHCRPLGLYENHHDLGVNLTTLLMHIGSLEQLLYTQQFPYHDTLRKIYLQSGGDRIRFQFLLLKNNHRFIAEKYVPFLGRAYNDQKAASIIYDLYPYFSYDEDNDSLYVFNSCTGLWSNSPTAVNTILSGLSNFLWQHQATVPVTLGGNSRFVKQLVASLSSIQSASTVYNFTNMKSSSLEKLLFPNGYYDGKIDKFIEAETMDDGTKMFFNTDTFFFAEMADPYIGDELTPELQLEADSMYHMLFGLMHSPEVAAFLTEIIALSLLGVKFKHLLVNIGLTNSGKSTLKHIMELAFKQYCGTGQVSHFTEIKNDSRDPTIVHAFAYDNFYRRIFTFSEKTDKVLDTEMLKMHSSGQEDSIIARTQYKSMIRVDVQYVMHFYVNQNFKVNNPNDPAFIDRAIYIHWNKQFVEESEITDPSSQIPRNKEVSQWCYNPRKRQLFTWLILQRYKMYFHRRDERGYSTRLPVPEECQFSKREEIGDNAIETADDILEKLLMGFVIDGDQNNFVSKTQFQEVINRVGINDAARAPTLLAGVLKQLLPGLVGESRPVRSEQRKIRGTKQNCWRGMRVRCTEVNHFVNEGDYLTDVAQWKQLMKTHNGILSDDIKRILVSVHNNFRERNLTQEQVDMIMEYGTQFQINYHMNVRAKRIRVT